jgi:hypothetical protein
LQSSSWKIWLENPALRLTTNGFIETAEIVIDAPIAIQEAFRHSEGNLGLNVSTANGEQDVQYCSLSRKVGPGGVEKAVEDVAREREISPPKTSPRLRFQDILRLRFKHKERE